MLYLYPKNTINFTNNGDPIHHSYDEHVIRDDGFYLTFNLLLDKEEDYKKIKKEMIVSADTPDGINQFRIYDIKNKSTVVEVTAVQLMYDFDNKEINPFSLKNSTGSQVISRFKSSFKSPLGQFTMDSSVTETHDFATNNEDDDATSHNALEVLNRITNRWDSELMLNGFDIRMIKRLGSKTDALLYEKKNISEFEDASSVSGMITRIHATSKFTPEGKEDEVTLSVTVDSPLINEYAQVYEKSYINNDCRTEAELIAWTKIKYSTENVDKPSRSITVSTNIIDGTEINYGDDLVLKYLVHDVDEIIRCVGYDYDPIKNTYYSVTLGDWKDSFLNTVTSNIIDNTNKQLNQIKNNITYISMSANGKNRNAYGPEPVPNPINGDNWYYYEFDRPNDVELRIFQDGFWVAIDFATKKEVEAVLDQADLDRTKAEQDINQALTDAKNYTEVKTQEFDSKLLLVNQNVLTATNSANAAVLKADKAIEDVGFLKPDVATAKANAATAIQDAATATQNASTAIQNAQTALNSVATLSQEVEVSITNINGELTRKVSQTTFNTLSGTVVTHTTQIGQTQNALLAKAESSLVNTIKGTVDTHTTQIKVVSDGLELKAESSLVNTVKGTVDNHSSLISTNSQAISARLTSAQIETLLTGKQYVNQTTLNATSSGLTAQITQVETGLSSKSDIVEQMTGAAGKVFKNPVSYNQNVQAITGYLIIKTPILSPFMSKVSISGYNYAGATSNIDLDVSFYAYTATQFVNFSYVNKGNFPIDSVKLARDSSGRTIIIIGKPTTVWNYPKMQVVQAIIGQTNPPENYKDGWSMEYSTDISVYTAQTNVTGPDYNTKITTIDVTVKGLQTTVANKAEQSQVTQLAGQVQTKVESATYNSKMTQLDSAINLRVVQSDVTAAILADKTVKDTRNDNQLPSWYNNNYARTSVTEFKLRTVMGLPGSATYVQLTTKSPWNGSSGGEIVQIAESADGTYQRTSVGNLITWGVWDKVAEAGKLISQINISTEGILLQGKRIQLDGDVAMNAAFIARLDTQTLTAVTANIASIRTQILTANIVDSIMIKSDTALITKLFATDANVQILTAKTAFVNSVKAIDVSADRMTAGTLNAALVNIINLNASKIATGTITGANSAWDLNTGIISVTNPTSGDLLQFTQGRIRFQNGAQERLLNYNAEGLQLKAGVNNTGTSKNTSLWLIGEGSGSYAYIQFVENNTASTDQRLEAEGGNIRVLTAPGGKFEVRTNGTRALNEILSSASQVTGVSGAFMRMTPGSIETERYGNRSLKLMPTGTGKVEVTDGTYWWNVKAKEFETVSSRTLKTNINDYNGNGLESIRSLNVVTYNLKQDLADGKVIEKIGLISEDSPLVAGSDGLSINTYTLNMLSLKALQELDRKVISIENVIFANNALASQALNKSNLVVSEMQQLKNKVTELELKIKKMESAA